MNMAGTHEFNEVFFDNVRIPAKNLLGEENRGWYMAVTTLDIERSNIGSADRPAPVGRGPRRLRARSTRTTARRCSAPTPRCATSWPSA